MGVPAMAQPPTIAYVNKIALVVQSDVYVDTLVNDTVMHILSPRIRIALTPRNRVTDTDQYLYVAEAMGRAQADDLLFRVNTPKAVKNAWRNLPVSSSTTPVFPYGLLLTDTLLQPGDSLVLEFKQRSSNEMIQRCVFMRENMVPVIQQFRENNKGSRVEDSILSKALHRNDKTLKGFSRPAGHDILLSAGKQLELILLHHGLNKDSTILYRTRPVNGNSVGGWKRSGHFLTIGTLPSNDSVVLELSYDGLQGINTYKVKIRPFWFERAWAIGMFIVSGILLFIVLPYVLHKRRLRNIEEKKQRDESEIKSAQSKLNPHFIFNSLNSVDGLVREGDAEKATAYIADFSDVVRNTLINSDIMFTRLSEDISVTEKYVRIEKLRFDFNYTVNIDPALNTETIDFPPLLLQPSIENAVKHGVSGMREKGLIHINFVQKNSDLLVTIEDNGPLYPKQHSHGTGKGISITRERIEKLKKIYGYEILYDLQFTPEKTLAIFQFKHWL